LEKRICDCGRLPRDIAKKYRDIVQKNSQGRQDTEHFVITKINAHNVDRPHCNLAIHADRETAAFRQLRVASKLWLPSHSSYPKLARIYGNDRPYRSGLDAATDFPVNR
jgi:hypothetical protein